MLETWRPPRLCGRCDFALGFARLFAPASRRNVVRPASGKLDRERASPAYRALNEDPSAVRPHQLARDSEPKAASGASLAGGELTVEIRACPRAGWDAIPDGRWEATLAGLRQWSDQMRVDRELVSLKLESEADLPEITRYLIEHDVDVYSLSPQRMSLEDLFMRLVGSKEER